MKAFRDLVETSIATGSLVGVDSLLADDVVFRSPVAFKPYPGKAITTAILNGVSRVFEDFRYVSSIEEGNRSALVFEATVDGVTVNGCDFITTNEDGLISEFTVMVRPMSGAKALMDAMAAQFPQIQADAVAYMEAQQ
ncbi:nuclear transport factor 2 family protein [Aeromicrobium duanguangcaii]|uniref:Nuclear transport factor 2 family protein n=1 Tax=Aeromicrobium duanguangcaii TaxID=2968086 RepID=A0ABY5KHE2_9ACTN|nr:nuclear transport factor 2 family protein [Aeromicrobium duanguangcaii]MCD9154489.1 nuclear transport factor 2 family protein [Aeromicrobium duanguangcaii]MCL3838237.1 nuclear transport factor 2 family protein [Aeromicrobium duanguangcaii]UUI68455.1 nuclear transport factor 2 family protein [Aeromicrobium duanguangcaii]